ncbi:hypothetical protein IFM89_023358 [Coptis chinensis]|uniref:Uncharacterized protein n=1 Tax=Coptis chinensis TaxID=261450 RepID=A0A835HGJ2_9MAGN|nr:hypothetical protein IFM89_023358 [Coptis chinensis]
MFDFLPLTNTISAMECATPFRSNSTGAFSHLHNNAASLSFGTSSALVF